MSLSAIVDRILSVVITGLTLGCLVFIIKFIKRANTEMVTLLQSQIDEFNEFKKTLVSQSNMSLTSIVDAIKEGRDPNQILNKQPGVELSQIFTKIKQVIGDDLYRTLTKTNACRTAIYLLHNGTKTIEGFNFIKISCIGERCLVGSGVKERIYHHSNMPVNIFDDMYETLLHTGRYIFMRSASDVIDTSKAEFISSPKIQYSQAVCLYDSSNTMLGFILAEFDHAYDTHTADNEYDRIKGLCKRLLPVFSYSEYTMIAAKQQSDTMSLE